MSDSPGVSEEPSGKPLPEAASADVPAPAPTEAPPPSPVIDTSTGLRDGVDRCPRCGSTEIQLRISTGMLICLFCRHEWAEEQIEEKVAGEVPIDELRGTTIASGASTITEDAETVTLKCQGCGAEVVINIAEATSSRCHWCRHVLSLNEQIPNGAVPDAVLPFAVTRADAIERITRFAGSRRTFADRRFLAEFKPDNVVGVYLPYLVVDGNVSADVHGVGEVQTRRYTRKQGESTVTYYDADVFQVDRHVDFTVDDLTLESSAEHANLDTGVNTNNIINTILPFDTKAAVAWNAHYLVGYTSERRNLDVAGMAPMFEDQLLSIARSQVEGSISGYDRGVRWETEGLTVHGSRWVAMYLPVWLYSYYRRTKAGSMIHYIAVNGRTGETMGSIPVSQPRLVLAALATGTVLEGIVVAILAAS